MIDRFKCFCTFVYDGDTIAIDPRCRGIKWIRLASIDAPEIEQQLGKESRNSLASLCNRKEVQINVITIDKYNRAVAQVLVDGVDASVFQVRQGMAFPFFLHDSNKGQIMIANAQARESRLGVWGLTNIVIPSQFRAEKNHIPASELKLSSQIAKVEKEESTVKDEEQTEEVTVKEEFKDETKKPEESEVEGIFLLNPRLFAPALSLLFESPKKDKL